MFSDIIYFAIYTAIIAILYFSVSVHHRWLLLLLGSYIFYSVWGLEFIPLIIVCTTGVFVFSLAIEKTKENSSKKMFLFFALVSSIGMLVYYKWQYFELSDTIVVIPIGLSFYSFQAASYAIDVYRGITKPTNNFGIFATYISFFPHLLAGPILRANDLIPQLLSSVKFDYQRNIDGLKLIVFGLFKKFVVANNIGLFVDSVYHTPSEFNIVTVIIATFFFGFQIYFDFSGYADIAVGIGKIFGINLSINFLRPYFSTSFSEFWKRWHITLSRWLRDYIYIPLDGRKKHHYLNLLIVFFICGLWHGGNLNFIFWGFLHALYLIISDILSKLKFFEFPNAIKIALVFVLTNFAWIFFRAESIFDSKYILTHLFSGHELKIAELSEVAGSFNAFLFMLGLISLMFIAELIQEKNYFHNLRKNAPTWIKWTWYYFIIFSIIFLGTYQNNNFIYFRF